MFPSSRPPQTPSEPIPAELQELAVAIAKLPVQYRDQIGPALRRVVDGNIRRRRILNLVQESLAQLRLDMKYLVFDLEATRRERDHYRGLAEGNADE
jgi:hypothetical protein